MASFTYQHTLSQSGDAQTQMEEISISAAKLLRSQDGGLGCSSIISSSDSLFFLEPVFLLASAVVTQLFLFQSFLSILSYPSLPLLPPTPTPFCWCCISQRDRLKQMPLWEMCMSVYVWFCVHALPPQIDSSTTCAQRQLPTEGGGMREVPRD